MSVAASQAIAAISMANLMDCYVSYLKPVLPFVILSVKGDCEVTKRNFKGKSLRKLQALKGSLSRISPVAKSPGPRLSVCGLNLTGLTRNFGQVADETTTVARESLQKKSTLIST